MAHRLRAATLIGALAVASHLTSVNAAACRPGSDGTCTATDGGSAAKKLGLKLYYFDSPQVVRDILSYAGLEYEDIRLSHEEFSKLKAAGYFTFGQVPALIVNGSIGGPSSTTVVQTGSIARFVGRLVGGDLYPADPLQASLVDSIVDQVLVDLQKPLDVVTHAERFGFQDVLAPVPAWREKLWQAVGFPGQRAHAVYTRIWKGHLPNQLRLLTALLARSPTGWLAGTGGPSIADFIAVSRLRMLRGIDDEIAKMVPGLAVFHDFTEVTGLMQKLDSL